MKKSTTIDANYISNLFEEKAQEILEKEKAPKKKSTKKVAEKSEVKAPKKTVKATKKADTEKVEDEKITKKAPTKKVAKEAEKPKKATTKAKAEKVEQEQEKALRKIEKSLKIAKSNYKVATDINSYDELLKAIESDREIAVAFDCSEVSKSDYENIFHVPHVKMKDDFDVCEPIFIGEKVPRLVFASIYSEALWDLFPEEFDLVSAVLEK